MEETTLHMVEEGGEGGGGGGGSEVVQVIMQEDGQIMMPEGQFIHVNTDDGQAQFIQVTGENGGSQLIQLTPDGQAHLVQVQEGQDGQAHIVHVQEGAEGQAHLVQDGQAHIVHVQEDGSQIIQISPDSLSELGEQHGLTVVMGEEGQTPIELETGGDVATKDAAQIMCEEGSEMGTIVIPQASEELSEQTEAEVTTAPEAAPTSTSPPTLPTTSTGGTIALPTTTPTTGGITHLTIIDPNTTMPADILQDDNDDINDTTNQATESGSEQIQDAPPTEQGEVAPVAGGGTEPPDKSLDLASPIPLTSDTIVVVGGKKCVLRVDPDSNHLVAYPFTPPTVQGKRGRGRPKKVRPEVLVVLDGDDTNKDGEESKAVRDMNKDMTSQDGDMTSHDGDMKPGGVISEQENSAAEGLLGLSEDGVRRSRRKRKKTQFLSDYETGVVEGEPEGEVVEEGEDEDVKPGFTDKRTLRGRPPMNTPKPPTMVSNAMQTLLMDMGVIPKKRGRGRPRRNPLPKTTTGPIPAFIIPQSNGNAVMMAQVQNMDNLQRSLVKLAPKPLSLDMSTKASTPTAIVIENSDGTTTQIITTTDQLTTDQLTTDQLTTDTMTTDTMTTEVAEAGDGSNRTIDGETDKQDEGQEDDIEEIEPPTKKTKLDPDIVDSGAYDDDVADPDYEPEAEPAEEEEEAEKLSPVKKDNRRPDIGSVVVSGGSTIPPAAIIQLPDNLVPLLIPKKTPSKIGLKATESELEKYKCPKCEFQAYYQRQFQEHLQKHAESLHKCKCCTFLAVDKERLVAHFKDAHPRCFCDVCDFMAEHAYVIKRHMVRHNNDGCECDICGKRYKDQYILKMHIKMVHMPAEVLFECQVCAKKFTRKAHLKRHLRIHEPEKPYKCSHCDYRGCEKSDITKHLLIHEEPRHVCEFCGKAFRHIKNKELHVKRHKGQRDYKCGVCDFYGYTFTDIRKHIERKHSDSKNILCDKCGSAFKNDLLLREHQKRQCQVLMFEQALSVVDDPSESTNTIHITPTSHLNTDEADQHIMIDGQPGQILVDSGQQHIMVDGQQHILVSGQQHIMVDGEQRQIMVDEHGQQIMLDESGHQIMMEGGQVNITVEQVAMTDEEQLNMGEEEEQLNMGEQVNMGEEVNNQGELVNNQGELVNNQGELVNNQGELVVQPLDLEEGEEGEEGEGEEMTIEESVIPGEGEGEEGEEGEGEEMTIEESVIPGEGDVSEEQLITEQLVSGQDQLNLEEDEEEEGEEGAEMTGEGIGGMEGEEVLEGEIGEGETMEQARGEGEEVGVMVIEPQSETAIEQEGMGEQLLIELVQ